METALRPRYWKAVWRRITRPGANRKAQNLPSNHNPQSDAELLATYRSSCSWPSLYYEKIQTLISLASPRLVVEVGVAYGYHADHILRHNPHANYVGIDPYVAAYDSDDGFDRDVAKLFGTSPTEAMDRLFYAVSKNLEGHFSDRATLVRSRSIDASKAFDKSSLPFVFIDGDHRYEAVLADLKAWWPKVEVGGALVGDDFIWPGVQKAVNEFFDSIRHPYYVIEDASRDHATFYAVKSR